jgi:tetratricopeptide (TPR) repeat protein
MIRHNACRAIAIGAPFFGAALLIASFSPHRSPSHANSLHLRRVLAAWRPTGQIPTEHLALPVTRTASITIDYPQDGSIFPPEILSPTFIWRDPDASATSWRIDIVFPDGAKPVHSSSPGEHMQIGEIDPRCISATNQLPSLTPEQAAAHTWKPEEETWTFIKHHSLNRPVMVTITGLDGAGRPTSHGRVTLSTSKDPVDGEIFYRDVPLMPSDGKKGTIQPLAFDAQPLINWRLRDIGQPQSRIVMHDMYTCANCHSFSADGKWMGIDVDGPRNDKGLYAIASVQKQMTIRDQDLVNWNTDRSVGKTRVGFMSQISPDGKYVLSTFAGPDQTNPSSYFVANFKDYRFLQVFYPTHGILTWYSRATGIRKPLPGADDPHYSQSNGVWSPDGKYIVFARAVARDSYPQGQPPALAANDPNETQIQYNLYRIPFNNGLGGKAEPIEGASDNGMSNSFPKVSPDGRWIVFVKCRNGLLMRPDSELFIVPATGGVARQLRANMSPMNSWHSFSPNGRWLVFSSKSRSPYTQMYLTHIDANGNDSPPIYIDNSTAANRAVNIPEFVNIPPGGMENIDVPLSNLYRVIDQAVELGNKGDTPAELAKWQEAVQIDPNSSVANSGLGAALEVIGKPQDAIPYLQKATRIDGDYLVAYYNLGNALAADGREDEAIDAWLNTVRIQPHFLEGRENLGYAYYKQAKFADSIAQLKLELGDKPDRLFALSLAATQLATCPDDSIRNGAEALTLAERANSLSGRQTPVILDALSAAYAESGRFAEAVETEKQAVELASQRGDTAVATTLKAHLAKYSSNLPLREPPDPGFF